MKYYSILHVGKGDFAMSVERHAGKPALDFDIKSDYESASMTVGKDDLIKLRDYLNSMELD